MKRILLILGICLTLVALGVALMYTVYPSGGLIIWYLGQAFIVVGILALILFGIACRLITYTIIWRMPVGDIDIEFSLPWWKRLLLLFIPPDLGEISAEVRYRYGDIPSWQHASRTQWIQKVGVEPPVPIGPTIRVTAPVVRTLMIWEYGIGNNVFAVNIERTRLPSEFDFNIRLVREDNLEVIKEYTDRYTQCYE